MDKLLEGAQLKVREVGEGVTLATNTEHYRFRRTTEPNHTCGKPSKLKVGDIVEVKVVNPKNALLVRGPCGCSFHLYDIE